MTKFTTPAQLADQLRVSTRTIFRWIAEGRIPSHKVGARLVRIDVDAALAALGIGTTATAKPNSDRKKAERERIAAAALLGGGR